MDDQIDPHDKKIMQHIDKNCSTNEHEQLSNVNNLSIEKTNEIQDPIIDDQLNRIAEIIANGLLKEILNETSD